MKKIYLTIFSAILLACASDAAAAAYKSVVINRHDGTSLTVSIEDDLKAAIREGNLELNSSKGSISLPVSECNKWVFSTEEGDPDAWSAIDGIATDTANVQLIRTSDAITLRGVKGGERITLVSTDGRVVSSGTATEGADFTISLDGTQRGVYIVAYGNHSLKIAIR